MGDPVGTWSLCALLAEDAHLWERDAVPQTSVCLILIKKKFPVFLDIIRHLGLTQSVDL